MRLMRHNNILNWFYKEAIAYPTPTSLSFFWSFGIMALVCLVSQIISGIFLAMHYIPSAELAFISVEHIMWDVRGGWFLRYLHANGASMFFLVVYLHICWGLYYTSFAGRREFVWYSGVIILFLMIITAFLGYVLPWGQMSFWAATVITSLASAIPLVGDNIVNWLWGGFAVGEQTLIRFYSLHYLLPFVLFALVAAHIILLHETGSHTPTGVELSWGDRITFGPYFFLKDLYYLGLFLMFFMYFVFFNPNYLGHPDNYIPALYMSTPAHIVPEWYFPPFYALLRSVPDKLWGVVAMLLSIIALALLPIIANASSNRHILTSNFMPIRAIFFSLFVFNVILLGWIGGQPIEEPMYTVGQYSSIFYFVLLFIAFPLINGFLGNQLQYERKNRYVWWQYCYYALCVIFGFLLELWRGIYRWIQAFGERANAREFQLYLRGGHPLCNPWIESNFDPTWEGYKKAILIPGWSAIINWDHFQKTVLYRKKIKQINFILALTGATMESEKLRLKNEKEARVTFTWYILHLVPNYIKDLFLFIFPQPYIDPDEPRDSDMALFVDANGNVAICTKTKTQGWYVLRRDEDIIKSEAKLAEMKQKIVNLEWNIKNVLRADTDTTEAIYRKRFIYIQQNWDTFADKKLESNNLPQLEVLLSQIINNKKTNNS